jgi:pilus assembly protein FimV
MSLQVPGTPIVPVRKSGTSIINIVLALAVMVAIGGVAFAVGRITAPATAAAAGTGGLGRGGFGGAAGGTGAFGGTGAAGGTGARGGFGAGGAAGLGDITVQGTVTDVSATGVTIKTATGLEVQVSTDGTTTYHQQAAGANTDVAVGKTVLVQVAGVGGLGGFAGGRRGTGATGASGAPAPVGAPGAVASPGAAGGTGAPVPGASGPITMGPAKDITIVGP